MAILKTPNTKPPGGFRYRQPETELIAEGDSLDDLALKISQHRVYRQLPRATLEECRLDVQRQICEALDKEQCRAEENDTWVPAKYTGTIKVSDAISLSQTAFGWLADGKPMVSIDEMKRRANICKNCPMNRTLASCKCSIFYKMVEKLIPQERRDSGLGICTACGCGLVPKTNIPIEVIRSADAGRDIKYPVWCFCYVPSDLPPSQ